ncbi:MAG TPA: phosphatidate cytidylyltransferase [Chloroflexota bacterium]|nr:phosphatidate cytidylyltransferase [Chloroflexota bacterium]
MLFSRLLTALVGIPIILGLVWLGGWPFAVTAAIVAALAAGEASRALNGASHAGRASLAFPMVGAAALALVGGVGTSAILAAIAVVLLITICCALIPVPTVAWTSQLAAVLYVGLPLSLLVLLRSGIPLSGSVLVGGLLADRGMAWVLLILTTVWAVDIAAYAVGRLVGRHKLWPRISPKKTWEGTVAGLLAGVLVWLAWAPLFGWAPALAGALGLLTAVAAIVGDLAESAIKRAAGLKDASALLPGHGGLLDRLDSLGFATVVVCFCRMLLGS